MKKRGGSWWLALCLLLVASPAGAVTYLGDHPTSATVYCPFNTNDQTGASVTFTGTTIRIYKNASATERTSSAGITLSKDLDTVTGDHLVSIDTSDNTDAGFYAAGNEYHVQLNAATIDTKSVSNFVCSFSLERSGGLLALIKARLPNATPGAAGGVFIAGTNAATTITTGSGAALTLAGTGTAKGLSITTAGADAVSIAPTAGSGIVIAANGTSKHAMDLTGGTAGTSDAIKLTAGTGGVDLRAATGITVDACTGCTTAGGTTLMPAIALVKGSTSQIVDLFIRDSTTNQGKTGLTSASGGLTLSYARYDQGNAGAASITPAAGTRGSWSSGGFVEKDATLVPGKYELGIPNAVVASGADYVVVEYQGVSGTLPTQLKIELVNVGLSQINTTLGTPAGASMSADIAANKTVSDAIKAKTDSLGFTGGNVNANTQATAASLSFDLTGNITGNLSGSVGSVTGNVGGNVGGNVVGSTASVTGNVGGNVTGSVGSVAAGGITSASLAADTITAAKIASDVGSELAAVAHGTFRKNIASQRRMPIFLRDATSVQAGKTGATVSVTVSKDGAAAGLAGGSVEEIGAGKYAFVPSQADTNCDTCFYEATATGAVPFTWGVYTTP